MPMTLPAFAATAEAYHRAGWPAVLPVPPETKSPPPTGFTGAEGQDTPAELLAAWAGGAYAHYSVALRMPDGVIGIDVDHYVTAAGRVKRGGDTFMAAVRRWGALPPTWTSTARGEGPSRIAFYRVPLGRYATVLRPDIEIIQRHHRYAVVWPSPHSETGGTYQWYSPSGSTTEHIPGPADLPELPASWVAGLAEGAAQASPASAGHADGEALLAALALDERPACSVMTSALDAAVRALSDPDVGTRHDTMTARMHRIVQAAAMGHAGFGMALPGLREQWGQLTAGEDRDAEFDRMVLSSARKAVTALNGVQQLADPCQAFGGPMWADVSGSQVDARPRPADNRMAGEDDGEPFEPLSLELPPILVDPSWNQVIGTEPFDPGVDLDHPMAGAMLRRTFYMARRASDTKSAWLLRGAEQWTLEGDLSGRIVSECVSLMPEGDPTPVIKGEDPTPAQRAHKRRVRLMGNGPATAVASTIKRHTDGGRHPATARIADLDRDPEILWAGAWPWDLRASREAPVPAEHVDPHTPHLAAAGVTPAAVPTPRWNAFLAAVWPDPEVRGWALRVLSIACTGCPDAALPILLGPGGTGKTSLITLLMEVLGSYAHAANVKLLTGEQSHDSIVFALKGRRLSFIDEGPRDGRWAQERLKQLTGGGQLTGNAMNQNPITFAPTHTLVLTSNTEPTLTDEAVRRRARLIPCEGDPIAVRAARAALTPRVWAQEAPGVLAQMMAEAAAWLDQPDTALTSAAPASIRSRADEIAEEQDYVKRWVEDCCAEHPAGTPAAELYAGFTGHCRDLNVHPARVPSLKAWALRLDGLGHPTLPDRRLGRKRPLRIRPRGWYDPMLGAAAPPPGGVTGAPGFVTGGDGSGLGPVTPHNPRSTYSFSSSVTGVTDILPMENVVERESPICSSNTAEEFRGEYNPSPVTDDVERGASAQVNPCVTGGGGPVTARRDPSQPPSDDVEKGASSQVTRKIRPKTEAQAERARVKAAERAAEREAARLDAVAAASGELLGLPAVVDRAGNVIPVSLDQAAAVVRAALARSGALTVDVETSGYPVGHVHYVLHSVQLGDATAAAVLDPAAHAETIGALLAEAPRLHAHSATADLVPLGHAGLIDPAAAWARMYDTVIPAKLADPQSTGSDPALKALAAAVLGDAATAPAADAARAALFKAGRWLTETQGDTPIERSGWAQVETGGVTMLRYAASDVLDTAALAKRLAQPDPAVHERERLAQRMSARITHRGMRIDAERVRELTDRHTAARAAAAQRVRVFGVDNPGSNPQVAAKATELGATLPLTKGGAPSVAEGVLDPLRAAEGPLGAFVRAVLDYRHDDTVLGTFLGPYRALCEYADGRARPTIYTLGTDTGRFSCVRPNLQQLPREGGVRACITADPGHVLISADFSGVEIRVAAALSGDETLKRMLADGRDLHAEIALQVFGPDPEATAKAGAPTASKGHRYTAKRIVFGRLYGGGLETLARQGGCDLETAQCAVDTLDALTPGLSAWSSAIRDAVRQGRTQFPSYSGRVIHLPREFPHKGPNFGIQGTAREALVDALVKWQGTRWGDATLLPVHDELVVMVPAQDAEDATAALVRCMTTQLHGVAIVAAPSAPAFAWQDAT